MIHLDTHVVAWLYAKADRTFIPAGVRSLLETEALAISPVVRLELGLLHEIAWITDPPQRILGELDRSIGLRTDESLFAGVVATAEPLTFTRDPFDRFIGAQAIVAGAQLATPDPDAAPRTRRVASPTQGARSDGGHDVVRVRAVGAPSFDGPPDEDGVAGADQESSRSHDG